MAIRVQFLFNSCQQSASSVKSVVLSTSICVICEICGYGLRSSITSQVKLYVYCGPADGPSFTVMVTAVL